MSRNSAYSGNAAVTRAIQVLKTLIPQGWTVRARAVRRVRSYRPDAVLEVAAPDGTRSVVLIEVKPRLSARDAADLGPRLAAAAERANAAGALLVAPFVSEMSRDRLRSAGVSYLDLTGNAWISLARPGLFISTQGATKDPNPPERGLRSLKGAKAARLVRALCDWRPPVGVRDLAQRAGTDPGYASRVIRFLEDEDLVTRGSAGQVDQADWQGLLRRWCRDYDVSRSNRAFARLAPRGIEVLLDRLRTYEEPYAVTGSLAAPPEASVAPARVASCYVEMADRAAGRLDLRVVETGANVLLLEPFDPVVFERGRMSNGLELVAMSQCTADLLTGTGREPAEAESVLAWMAANEDAWRT